MSRRDSVARAEARLRAADPVDVETMGAAADDAGLARVLDTPRAARSGAHRSRAVLRVAVDAGGLLVLGGLVVALFLTTRGGDPRTAGAVEPPPLRFSVLARPQSRAEETLDVQEAPSDVVRSSVRLADQADGVGYVLFRQPSGDLCMKVQAGGGSGGGGCGFGPRPTVQVFTAVGLFGGGSLISGLVPDAITTVLVNGRPVGVRGNVFHVVLPAATPRAVLDYMTADGVVPAWHDDVQLIAARPDPTPPAPFDDQARLLQTRPPHLGVFCPTANDFGCDRVGITVWLRNPALRVEAKVWGRRVILDDPTWSGPIQNGRRTRFTGFLEPAGLLAGPHRIRSSSGGTTWLGSPKITAPVTILVYSAPDTAASAAMRVRLSPGWR